jgi:hypothetical protein
MRVTADGEIVVHWNEDAVWDTDCTVLRVLGRNGGAGATQVIIQAGANQAGVNLLEWRDNLGISWESLTVTAGGAARATPLTTLHGGGDVGGEFGL